ncbi:MAG: hypothetical protein K6F58_01365 [Bacteroidales bacterium]|nr:hypothetical protein [Bacteroidales bacterium]
MADERLWDDIPLPGIPDPGNFHLDDLDFADDPLKRKIDFIDDALLEPPDPRMDITSGIRTSREVMGERPSQPTDAVGMRPEDYIGRKRKEEASVREETEPLKSYEGTSGTKLTESQARYVAAHPHLYHRDREQASASYDRWKQDKQQRNDGMEAARVRAFVPGKEKIPRTKNKKNATALLLAMIFILISMIGNLAGFLTESETDHSESYVSEESYPEEWEAVQMLFLGVADDEEIAASVAGESLVDIGITGEMLDYLRQEAYEITEDEEKTVYETEINGLDVDLYEYAGGSFWLRFWSEDFENVTDVGFMEGTNRIDTVMLNNEVLASA